MSESDEKLAQFQVSQWCPDCSLIKFAFTFPVDNCLWPRETDQIYFELANWKIYLAMASFHEHDGDMEDLAVFGNIDGWMYVIFICNL